MVDEEQSAVQRFLDVEEAATLLVSSLESVREESKHYSAASLGLDTASAAIAETASEYLALASQFGKLSTLLREIGMPAVVESQSALNESVNQTLQELAAAFTQAQDSLDAALAQRLSSLGTTLTAVHDALKESVDKRLSEVGNTLRESQDALKDVVGQRLSNVDSTLADVRDAVTQVNTALGDANRTITEGKQVSTDAAESMAEMRNFQEQKLSDFDKSIATMTNAVKSHGDQQAAIVGQLGVLEELASKPRIPEMLIWILIAGLGVGIATLIATIILG
jgi:chromosome segregation ATPase